MIQINPLWMLSVHSVTVVFVIILAQKGERSVGAPENERGMMDAVEHVGLDCRVVDHIFEDDGVPHLQWRSEAPISHKVAAQAGVSAEAIDVGGSHACGGIACKSFGITHCGMVGHF